MKTNTSVTTPAQAKETSAAANATACGLIKKEIINHVALVGNLGAAPEVVELTSGMMKASFRVATNRYFKNKNNEWQSQTTWHNVVAWGPMAQLAKNHLDKGTPVSLEGRLSYRMFVDSKGVERFRSEVIVSRMLVIPAKTVQQQKLAA
jgi:single-strand DNA-binding protein